MAISKPLVGIALACLTCGGAAGATYDPASDFLAGWTSASNPNSVWSYGYSASFGGAITLYDARTTGADSANEIFWISSSVNCCDAAPAVGFNNGPAFDDGNVALAANQMDLVGSVYQGLVTDLVFTAPSSGSYDLTSSFIGAQRSINVDVEVLKNASSIFSSSVTSFGQVVPFDSTVHLASGDTLTFAVYFVSGTQNTGLDLSLTTGVPEPRTWALMALGFVGVGFTALLRRRIRTQDCATGLTE